MPTSRSSAASTATSGGMTTPPERALDRAGRRGIDPAGTMKIGEVSERLGLSLRSIRYYEETGLVSPAARTAGGFRLYSELDVQRLLLIMQMKPLDFSLDEMRQVLGDLDALERAAADADALDARRRLEAVSHEVEQRYASLRQRLDIATMFREHLAGELGETGPLP